MDKSKTIKAGVLTKGIGRPSKHPSLLPDEHKMLAIGHATYTDELGEQLAKEYYLNDCSLTKACKKVGVRFHAALKWRRENPHFNKALLEIKEIVDDEIHENLVRHARDPDEKNPTWLIFYIKNHFPQYADKKQPVKVTFELSDSLIKPEVIQGEVIPPLALESGHENRPSKSMDTPPNSAGVSAENSGVSS